MELKRSISSGLRAALSGPFFYPLIMIELDWPDEMIRAHSGVGTISWGGFNWLGVGQFGEIETGEESATGVPTQFTMSLTAPFPELAAHANAMVRQRAGRIYVGATTEAGGNSLRGSPALILSGVMDTLVLKLSADAEGNQTYGLTVGFTTGPSYRSAASIKHSHEDQSRRSPADTAGRHLMLTMTRAENTLWPEP